MNLFLIVFAFVYIQEEVPFKPGDAFEVKFDLSFKQRPQTDPPNTVRMGETKQGEGKTGNAGPLPYLMLEVKILKVLPEEARVKVYRDNSILVTNKKITAGMELKLEPGFTDDIKDGVSGYKHVIEFLSSEKRTVSKIVIEFDKEGNYLLNGERRGKI